jgi:hypothetical protein
MSEVMEDDYGFNYCTVGPFEIEHEGCDHVEDAICTVSGCNHNAAANGRLIAAAPDLLAALKTLTQDSRFSLAIGGNPNAVDALVKQVDRAIAKAEGR